MSLINGEKGRANLQKRRTRNRRIKERAARAAALAAGKTEAPAAKPKARKSSS